MKLAGKLGDGESLLTPDTLERLGFSRPMTPSLPALGGEVVEGSPGEPRVQGAGQESGEIGGLILVISLVAQASTSYALFSYNPLFTFIYDCSDFL